MARMYDHIMAGSLAVGHLVYPDSVDAARGAVRSVLASSEVVVADNVAKYYFEEDPRDVWELENGDFPNIAPPFPSLWVEYAVRNLRINKGGHITEEGVPPYSVGCLLQANHNPEIGWSIRAGVFMAEVSGRNPVMMGADAMVGATPTGAYRRLKGYGDEAGIPVELRGQRHRPLEAQRRLVAAAVDAVKPIFLAVSFMHCKNVQRREVEQSQFDRHAWQKKHKRPLVRYHVLDIDPMRKTLHDEGGIETHGLKKALHICRGHFATYTEDAPLFGRVTGTFWKPQHVRGSAKSGVVLKDYNVKAPR